MQESSSEAVNAYYGVYLLGKARDDTDLADWGRLLLAMELRSAKKYGSITTIHHRNENKRDYGLYEIFHQQTISVVHRLPVHVLQTH